MIGRGVGNGHASHASGLEASRQQPAASVAGTCDVLETYEVLLAPSQSDDDALRPLSLLNEPLEV